MTLLSRLDTELVQRSLTKSRTLAQTLIKDGIVYVNGGIVQKPSFEVTSADEITVKGDLPKYVGRGGIKLEKAITDFGIKLDGCTCIDAGASTGGFTDCMLQNGAARVYAVDVGSAQLDEKLRADKRVISLENTDIRNAAEKIPEKADFITADVSFISLKLVLPEIKNLLKPDGEAVALIKPQFEVGKSGLNKHGVVKNEALRAQAAEEIKCFAADLGFTVNGVMTSPITGGEGNIEYLIHLSL
ncbi:MAG: TlyA family RNA methyltransferase [Oscillospiraceae bacterium]|nr:TlyA family RNA methyltransferase [Oscillospiraceae bacterium]